MKNVNYSKLLILCGLASGLAVLWASAAPQTTDPDLTTGGWLVFDCDSYPECRLGRLGAVLEGACKGAHWNIPPDYPSLFCTAGDTEDPQIWLCQTSKGGILAACICNYDRGPRCQPGKSGHWFCNYLYDSFCGTGY